VKIQEIYDFYTKEKIGKLKKSHEEKRHDPEKKSLKITDAIEIDRTFFKEQLNSFIKKYMKWHFGLRETSFLKDRLEKKTNFIFKRVSISPDAKKMARLDYDRNLSIHDIGDIMNPKEIFTIYDIFVAGRNIRFSHDSKKIAFYDLILKEINVWNIEKKEREFVYKDTPTFLTFSKNSDILGIVLEEGLKFYKEGSLISETNELKSCFSIDFAFKKEGLVCIVVDQNIILWDFYTNKILFKYEGEPEAIIKCASFLTSDSKIIIGTMNRQIILWDYNLDKASSEKKALIILREHQNEVLNVLISEDEKYIFSYENVKQLPNVYIWKKNENDDEYKLKQNFIVQTNNSSEAFAENNVVFGGYDSYIYKYDIIKQKSNSNNKTHFGKRTNLSAYSLDSKFLLKYSHNNIAIFNVASGEGESNVKMKKIPHALTLSSDNTEIALTTKEELLIFDRVQDPNKDAKEKCSSPVDSVMIIIRYINNKKLVTGDKEGDLWVWNIKGASLESIFLEKNHEFQIHVLSIHNNKEEMFCSGDVKGKIAFWNVKNLPKAEGSIEIKDNQSEDIPQCINAKFLNPPQKCIIGNSKSLFAVWNLQKPSENINTFKIEAWPAEEKSKVAASDFDLSLDEQRLAVIFVDGSLVIWSLPKNEVLQTYQFFKYEDLDRGYIEVCFSLKNSNSLIIRAKESYKEINIDPEVTELKNIKDVKAITNDRRIISLDKEEGIITITNMVTEESKSIVSEDHQELCNCFLSSDHKRIFAYNFENYFVWDLNTKKNIFKKSYKMKKDLYVAHPKIQKEMAFVADPNKGHLFGWFKESFNPFENKLTFVDYQDFIHNAVKLMTGFDISYDDQKMLIESDNNKIIVLVLQNDKTWKKSEVNFNNQTNNMLYSSKFSSKSDNIYNIMIENNIYKIIEWSGETGEILRSMKSNSPIIKMIIEPQNDHLFILTSKEKRNIFELFSFNNKVFISLSDAEDENPENFFMISQKQQNIEIILSFGEKIKVFHNFFTNSSFLLQKKKKLSKIFDKEEEEKEMAQLRIVKKKKTYEEEINEKSTSLLSTNTRIFPFNYNFLQIMAYDQDFHNVQDKIFELINNDKRKLEISFEIFFQKDIHGRNCFDIAFLSKNTNLFRKFLMFIKNRYKITELKRTYREYLNSEFFFKMFSMFKDDPITSDFLNFVFVTPLDFPQHFMYRRMKDPILEILEEPCLIDEKLKDIIKKVNGPKQKEANEVDELVLAKCFYPHQFLDYSNEATQEIFKLVSEFDPMNPIFESRAIIKLLDHKWKTYGWKKYFFEAVMFLIFLLIYIINVDFFFVNRIETEIDELSENHLIFSICSVIIDGIILSFLFRLIYVEVRQLLYFGYKDYFNSFWNFNDIFYISLSLISTILDLCSCFDLNIDYDILKSMQSFTIFVAFFRLMSYARGIEESSFMIKLIIRVIFDIRYFLFLMILYIVSLSCSGNK